MLKLKGKNILVTGGAGFIGSHLVDRIIRDDPASVVVVDNLFLGQEANLQQARRDCQTLKFYRQDAADYDAMKQIVAAEAVNVIFNLAVIPLPTSLERPRWTVEVNVAIAAVAAELLREGLYQTLIHFSSSEAYGSARYVPMDERHPIDPATPYAASKAAGDHVVLSYCKTFGVDAAIIRPFNNFGPRQNDKTYAGVIPIVVRRALRGEPAIIYGDGEQTRDFISVHDTVDAAVRIYEETATRGQVINIASGQETSINRLVDAILDVLGVDVPIIHSDPRPGDVRRHCGDIELARQMIEFKPRVSLAEGLVETVTWYRQQEGGEV